MELEQGEEEVELKTKPLFTRKKFQNIKQPMLGGLPHVNKESR